MFVLERWSLFLHWLSWRSQRISSFSVHLSRISVCSHFAKSHCDLSKTN